VSNSQIVSTIAINSFRNKDLLYYKIKNPLINQLFFNYFKKKPPPLRLQAKLVMVSGMHGAVENGNFIMNYFVLIV
jgi:hypothetical protein